MDVPDSVIAKIKKLLNLSESANENEAALAAAKAQDLMFKHNLEIGAVQGFDLRPDEKVEQFNFDIGMEEGKKNIASWKQWLFNSVAETSMCKPYVSHGRYTSYGRVIGRKADVEAAQYTFSWLLYELERLANAYMADQIWFDKYDSRRMKRSWLEGAALGVSKTLRAEFESRKTETEASTALVIVRDREIDDWMENNGLKLQSRKSGGGQRDSKSFNAGFQTGSNLSMRRGVSGGSTARIGGG